MRSMPKKRNSENKGFPTGWRAYHGAIYYRVPKGQEWQWDGKKQFRLGSTPSEAYKTWADRIGHIENASTIGDLLDRYSLQVTTTKAPKTQNNDACYVQKLRGVFGDMPLTGLQPQHIYKYVDKRTAKISAKREIALLSHAFTKAVEWGYIGRHPFKGEIRLEGEKPRTRYVQDWEILEVLALPRMRHKGSVGAIQAYIRLKLLTGMRRGDLLRLKISSLKDEGICVTTNKTGKPIIYEWSESLRLAVELAKSERPVDISPYLFCTKRGESYLDEKTGDCSGWASMWQRFFDRVKAETKVTEHFTEHDLRAKVASDAGSLEHARQLLAHADSRITDKVYRRKPETVKPAK